MDTEHTTVRPRRTRAWLWGGAALVVVALVLAAGAGGWWLANRTVVASTANAVEEPDAPVIAIESVMPDVRGLTLDDAVQVLADSGFPSASVVVVDAPSGAPAGIVVTQDPAFGAASPGVITLGVAVAATMPDLVGAESDAALAALADLAVVPAVALQYSAGARVGTVVATVPAVGEALAATATVVVAAAGTTAPLGDVRRLSGPCSGGGAASLGGEDFASSVQCRAGTTASTTVWFLQAKADVFTATVGIDDTGTPGSTASIEVFVDGVSALATAVAYGDPVEIEVPVSGVLQLAVRVSAPATTTVVLGDADVLGSADAIAVIAP